MRLSPFMIVAVLGLDCSPPKVIPGVLRLGPGETLSSVPGPMPGFGPFSNFSDALLAACPLILGKPHALAGRPTDENFGLRWKLSQEYCAWLYYTPDDKYEMSMLVAATMQPDPTLRTCDLPSVVDDRRYAPKKLGYVFVLHNHPYGNTLSKLDIRFIVSMAAEHDLTVKTRSGVVPISIIAFYSNSDDPEHPTCDGFFQYVPGTGELMKWTPAQGHWTPEQIGTVTWTGPGIFHVDYK